MKWAEAQLDMLGQKSMFVGVGAREMIKSLLSDMSIKYEENGDDAIIFRYRGGQFVILANDDCDGVLLNYFFIYGVELTAKRKVTRLKRLINEENSFFLIQFHYTIDREEGMMYVHCKYPIYYLSRSVNPWGLLRDCMNDLFSFQEDIYWKMEKRIWN